MIDEMIANTGCPEDYNKIGPFSIMTCIIVCIAIGMYVYCNRRSLR